MGLKLAKIVKSDDLRHFSLPSFFLDDEEAGKLALLLLALFIALDWCGVFG